MKKIIVPVDFSEHALYALEMAAKFAKKHDAEILAIHMLEIPENILSKSSNNLQREAIFFLKLAKKKFNTFLEKPFLKNIKVTPIIKHFKVFKELNDVAILHNADLIVMGSHGSSGLKEIFVGSNTEKVVRHSEIPVFVIQHKPGTETMDTIVFASDFQEESINAYKKARKLLKSINSKLLLLFVNLPNSRFLSQLEMENRVSNFLSKADGSLKHLKNVHYTSDYSVEKGVLNFSKKMKVALIAIATHGRKGIAHFLEGSITEDLANHSKIPVITFKI